jgi:CheY-like chemotaxis protein
MVDVAEVTGSVVDTCRRFAASHGADLRLDIPGRMPPVRVNRVALRQILLNALQCLVRVAHRQSAGHGAPILVQGEQTAQGVTVVLRWENQSGETAGAGTGLVTEEVGLLAVAREIAGLQGASVDEGWDRSGALEVRVHVPAGSVRTVLLVDDNPDMGELFRRMLHKTPYSVVHARTAGRALSLAQENVPDIIILDVVMPTRDGWEILAALQINPTTADIPVLICSVLPDREFALSLGATGFLTKPVIRRALLCALDSLIEAAPTHQSASLS